MRGDRHTGLDGSCSALSVSEPLAGTAPHALAWIAIEHPGSWGRDALRSDALPHGVGPVIADRAKAAGVGVLLIRHPDRSRSLTTQEQRLVWFGHNASNTLSCLGLDDPRELLDLDLPGIAAGILPGSHAQGETGIKAPSPLLALVCCHASRDACCATRGRALYDELLADSELRPLIWQSSHLGGHRFAPTMLLLPHGMVYGRIPVSTAQAAIDAALLGNLHLAGSRGRTHLPGPVQAADLHLRDILGCTSPDDLSYELAISQSGDHLIDAAHSDGRRWAVIVRSLPSDQRRPMSCGADDEPIATWQVDYASA